MKLTAQKTEISPIEDYISTDYNPHYFLKMVLFTMFDFNLPLEHHFLNIFENYEINNWEAKQFWSKFDVSENVNHFRLRQNAYLGIKILSKKGYLSFKCSPNSSKIFWYSETHKLKQIRINNFKKNYRQIFMDHKNKISNHLDSLNLQDNFANELIAQYPELTSEITTYQKDIKHYKKKCKAKILTLNDLIEIL